MTKVNDVFVPNDTPKYTYVEREGRNLETDFRRALNEVRILISVSGPSKSGKTVLIDRCIESDRRITVSGASIQSSDDLWKLVASLLDASVISSRKETEAKGLSVGGEVGAEVPLLAKSHVVGRRETSSSQEEERLFAVDFKEIAMRSLRENNMTLFIDDFHYIKESARSVIGRDLKAALERGVKIIAASVPYKTDDVVRSNIELRGRVFNIDSEYWSPKELARISELGFEALNGSLPATVTRKLSEEAIGSPQLMQTICLQLCYEMGIEKKSRLKTKYTPSDQQLSKALAATARYTDFSKMFKALSAGPRVRGQERKEYRLITDMEGDVYSAVLRAISMDPASLSMPYDEIQQRVKQVCVRKSPVGSSVTSALEQMSTIARSQQGDQTPLIWNGDNLEITDPYFLFFLRCSDKILDMEAESRGSA